MVAAGTKRLGCWRGVESWLLSCLECNRLRLGRDFAWLGGFQAEILLLRSLQVSLAPKTQPP